MLGCSSLDKELSSFSRTDELLSFWTSIARHSLEYSSIKVNIRKARPL